MARYNNQPKLVGFDTNPSTAILPTTQRLMTLTVPICFRGKRLAIEALDDATGASVNCIINSIRWNNHDLLAGGPILSSALPSVWATAGSNSGAHINWSIPFEVADVVNVLITNQSGLITIVALAYWVTDYGDKPCKC